MLPNLPLLSGEWATTLQIAAITNTEWTEIAPADPTRWSIGFSSMQLAGFNVTLDPSLPTDQGWPVNFATPLEFHYKDWGPMVQQAWHAFDTRGTLIAMWYASYIRKLSSAVVNSTGASANVH